MEEEKKKRTFRFTMPSYIYLTTEGKIAKMTTKKHKKGDYVPPKKFYLNLNDYNTWFYLDRNEVKKRYMNLAVKFLFGIKMSTPIRVTFVQYKHDNRRSDRANACSVHEKFFCDALVKAGCIPDDNDRYILETRYLSGGVEKDKARMEIIVEEL